jgi:hypothetical protein
MGDIVSLLGGGGRHRGFLGRRIGVERHVGSMKKYMMS